MPSTTVRPALSVLSDGVDSYASFLQPGGELVDPIVGGPTQYGTPYHAWSNAVLAADGDPDQRDDRISRALRGLTAAVAHVADPTAPATWSGFDRRTGAAMSNGNHRDFFWPPILKTWLLLGQLGADSDRLESLWQQIRGVELSASFRAVPPSNWAMVWCSGEWLRIREGGSTHTKAEFDDWLEQFFAEGFDVDLGLYVERGLPNAYDLFTRVHLAEICANGYDGRHRARIGAFLTQGLRRSLEMQLSDGSVASGFRSAGQTWTLGAQVAFFTYARQLGLGTDQDQRDAAVAAVRTCANLQLWQRPGGEPFSPVQNLQPPWRRIGYERYTADGHYANLALAFLASAVHAGFTGTDVGPGSLDSRPSIVRVEQAPTFRAAAHAGRISIAVQAQADQVYDGNGLVDVTFGAGRVLQIASSAQHLSGGPWFNPGLGVRQAPGRTPTVPISWLTQTLTGAGLQALTGQGIALETTLSVEDDHPLHGWTYRLRATVQETGVSVVEETPGHPHHPVLFLPYPVDLGAGLTTTVTWTRTGARLELAGPNGAEWVEVVVDAAIVGRLDLNRDYSNRRGECGLIRIDLAGPAEKISWRLLSG